MPSTTAPPAVLHTQHNSTNQGAISIFAGSAATAPSAEQGPPVQLNDNCGNQRGSLGANDGAEGQRQRHPYPATAVGAAASACTASPGPGPALTSAPSQMPVRASVLDAAAVCGDALSPGDLCCATRTEREPDTVLLLREFEVQQLMQWCSDRRAECQ